MTNSTGYAEAVQQAANPSDFNQATELLYALGDSLVIMLAVPLVLLFLAGGIVEVKGEKLWSYAAYWILFFAVLLSAVSVLFGFPYVILAI